MNNLVQMFSGLVPAQPCLCLPSYKNFGSGPVKYPLADMLQYVLEFASTRPSSAPPTPNSTAPRSSVHTSPAHTPSPWGQRRGDGGRGEREREGEGERGRGALRLKHASTTVLLRGH